MIGKTILHYKINEKLGEGGMGIVYKAHDNKLKRDVAIKFLPRHIAIDSEERRRFEIEAQAAAALNHSNVATIFAIENELVPPTINLTNPDPECDLNYCPLQPTKRKINYALSNTFGFGGHNASLLFKKFEK